MKAIGIRFVPFLEDSKNHPSRFFGPLICPEEIFNQVDDLLFLGMIHLPEIAELDKENRLPHKGYLYFFMDVEEGYRRMMPYVFYSEKEPELCCDDFNEPFIEEYGKVHRPIGIEFYETDADASGCKLFGEPYDWNYADPPKTKLLLTISHMDEELNFLPQLDGFTYIFFGEEGNEFEGAYAFYEYS